jgi:two-component system chemotaxis response regulator CheY
MAKIMVVDDSGMSRRLLREILESEGYEVIEAIDGMSALETYYLQKPDLVLLDLIMRGMYGLDVLKKIRELDKNARVIVASADIQTSTRRMTQEEGAIDFVTKPFNAEQVLASVRTALNGGTDGS